MVALQEVNYFDIGMNTEKIREEKINIYLRKRKRHYYGRTIVCAHKLSILTL